MDDALLAELELLLRRTGEAHHAAFAETDGGDPEWPSWYAAYLQAHLGDRLGTWLTRSELTYLLVRAERERQGAGAAAEPWPRAYARALLER